MKKQKEIKKKKLVKASRPITAKNLLYSLIALSILLVFAWLTYEFVLEFSNCTSCSGEWCISLKQFVLGGGIAITGVISFLAFAYILFELFSNEEEFDYSKDKYEDED